MKMRHTIAASIIAITALSATAASAATNLATISAGATFVSGSSFINIPGYSQSIAETDLLTPPPAPSAYFNGDTRYIFGGGQGSTQTLEINLGGIKNVASFAATFGATDRTPQGLTVSVSTDNINFTTLSQPGLSSLAGTSYTVSPTSPVLAQYVAYSFGGPSSQYGYGGSGISELFATAVPEPATWALLLLGFFGMGFMVRSARRKDVLATA